MSTVSMEPLLHHSVRESVRCAPKSMTFKPSSLSCSTNRKLVFHAWSFCNFRPSNNVHALRASTTTDTGLTETVESTDVFFKETFPLKRMETVEGKIFIRLDHGPNKGSWQLTVRCNLPGKWILHWGISRVEDVGREWDQPPAEMRPPGSIPIKDYAIETPLKKLSSPEGDTLHEVKIDLIPKSAIAAINFVLKDEETGAWYQHRGRDFKVPLAVYLQDDGNLAAAKRSFSIWPGFRSYYVLP